MTGKPLRTNADLPEHRVAVVVFTSVRAVDYADGAAIVTDALRKVIRDSPGEYSEEIPHARTITFEVERTDESWKVPVTVRAVMDLAMATGNGYIAVAPSSAAYRGAER